MSKKRVNGFASAFGRNLQWRMANAHLFGVGCPVVVYSCDRSRAISVVGRQRPVPARVAVAFLSREFHIVVKVARS